MCFANRIMIYELLTRNIKNSMFTAEFLILCEAWAKVAQQWLVSAPLAQRENCGVPNKKLFGPMVRHMSLSKTLVHSLMAGSAGHY